MTNLTIQRSLRFDTTQYAYLKQMASRQACSISDVLRRIISEHQTGGHSLTASQLRQARVVEYAQAALDTIINEQHPEYRERILAETDRRMERYHGAR